MLMIRLQGRWRMRAIPNSTALWAGHGGNACCSNTGDTPALRALHPTST